MLARFCIAAALVGAATVPIVQPVHAVNADVSLRSSASGPFEIDTLLSGSGTAIVLGPTGIATPSPEYAQTAEDLYLHPLLFDGGATDSGFCDMSGTDPCNATLQILTTPETSDFDQSVAEGTKDVVQAVENEFSQHPGAFDAESPLTVFGYSQGASISSAAMVQLAQAGIPLDAVHFVFVGDTADQAGAQNNAVPDLDAAIGPTATKSFLAAADMQDVVSGSPGVPTPNDLYPTTIYTLDGDGWADFQHDWETGGAPLALLGMNTLHLEYFGLTPAQIANSVTTTNGDIVDHHISDADVNNAVALAQAGLAGGGGVSELNDTVPGGISADSPLGMFEYDLSSLVNAVERSLGFYPIIDTLDDLSGDVTDKIPSLDLILSALTLDGSAGSDAGPGLNLLALLIGTDAANDLAHDAGLLNLASAF